MTLPHTWTAGASAYVRWQFRLAKEGDGYVLSVKELDAKPSKWRVVCRWRNGQIAQFSGHHQKAAEYATILLREQDALDKLVAETETEIAYRRRGAA